MKICLREITFSDNSKAKYLVINNEVATGRVKISAKQWKELSKFGFQKDQKVIDTTSKRMDYISQ